MFRISVPDGRKFFRTSGYREHYKGADEMGFVRKISPICRWHAKKHAGENCNGEVWQVHMDVTTKENMHRVEVVPHLENQEKRRLKKHKLHVFPSQIQRERLAKASRDGLERLRQERIKALEDYDAAFAPKLRDIQKITNHKRKWYNPLRYLIGKFYVKNAKKG